MKMMRRLLENLGGVWNSLPKEVPLLKIYNDGKYNLLPPYTGWTLYNKATMMSNFVDRADTETATFVGKISGSTIENPNVMKRSNGAATLIVPTGNWAENFDFQYGYVSSLNGAPYATTSNTTSTFMAQQLFSFNVIEIIERKHGISLGVDLAAKVAKAKEVLRNLTFNWHGFGSGQSGNKANLRMWNVSSSNWDGTQQHTNASVTKVTVGSSAVNVVIDANGFVHYLAFADPSDGSIASSISTDYVELVLDYVKPWANNNKSSGAVFTSLLVPTGPWSEFSIAGYGLVSTLNGSAANTSALTNGNIAQQLFSFDLIAIIERKYNVTLTGTLADKVAWVKANVTKLTPNWHGFGSSVGGYKAYLLAWRASDSQWLWSTSHTNASVTKITLPYLDGRTNGVPSTYIDNNGFVHFLAYADAAGLVANPTTAPTLSASGSGSGLSAGTYYVTYLWYNSASDTTLSSPQASITITAGQNIVVTVPDFPFGVVGARISMGTVSGSTTRQGITTTTTYTQSAALVAGIAPPVSSTCMIASTINTDYIELLVEANVVSGITVSDAQIDPNNPYKLNLSATIDAEASYINVDVAPNTPYVLSYTPSTNAAVAVYSADGSTVISSYTTSDIINFNSGSNANIRVYFKNSNGSKGDISFTDPALTVGTQALTPFRPKAGTLHDKVTITQGMLSFHSAPFRSDLPVKQEILTDGLTTAELLATINAMGYLISITSEAETLGLDLRKAFLLMEVENVSITSEAEFTAFTSKLWTTMYPVYRVLQEAEQNLDVALKQLYRDMASGDWLDFWASFFDLKREPSENDNDFIRRFTMNLFNPRTNNIALKELLSYRLRDNNIDVRDLLPNQFEVLVGTKYLADASALHKILLESKAAGIEYFLNYVAEPYAEDYQLYLADATGKPFNQNDELTTIGLSTSFADVYPTPEEAFDAFLGYIEAYLKFSEQSNFDGAFTLGLSEIRNYKDETLQASKGVADFVTATLTQGGTTVAIREA